MHLARRIMTRLITLLILTIGFQTAAFSQENSPYSRYGLGDLVPNHNIMTRAMGGISAAFSDAQSVNFINPASYANLRSTIFDIGAEVDTRTLKSLSPSAKYSATNLIVSYLNLGLPISMKKANKKGITMGMNIGLRPISRINYKIQNVQRLSGIDSLNTTYSGDGGVNEAFLGAAIRIKHFSVGFNAGYMFGNKNYSTVLSFANDSVQFYQSNSGSKANFGGLSYNFGFQYYQGIKKNKQLLGLIQIGGYFNLKQNLKATQTVVRETIGHDAYGGQVRIDSVYQSTENGNVSYPATYGLGITYQDSAGHWLIGADYEATTWTDYSFFSENSRNSLLQNSWKFRVGAQYFPANARTPLSKYFNFVRYRLGFFYGPDYIKLNNNMPEYGITFGAGFPLKLRRTYFESQSSVLNTTFEIGSRGDSKSNLRENLFRLSFGLSLSDIWFIKRKYQ